MKITRFPRGTRIRVRKGRFPMDPALVGRTGLVLHPDWLVAEKVGVQLDGEERLRTFTEDELEAV
ncbi:MAG: hypothetical protein EA350_16650 [Gemmatimonadales bacterium]|nr:MAG: hypothetical protein EA350_16650 [Gemmatimonadales bacterium]